MNYFNLVGLIFNLGGALMLVFSTQVFDPTKGTGASIKIFSHNLTITTIKKKPFIGGIALLIFGFVLQLIGMFYS